MVERSEGVQGFMEICVELEIAGWRGGGVEDWPYQIVW